jgi:hypothetical protein
MEAELRYQLSGDQAKQFQRTGRVLDISSKAVAFRTEDPIKRDTRLKVSLPWPAKLGECRLRLSFEGVVLRTRGNLVVVSIERPDFRTAGRDTGSTPEEVGAGVPSAAVEVFGQFVARP